MKEQEIPKWEKLRNEVEMTQERCRNKRYRLFTNEDYTRTNTRVSKTQEMTP